MSGGCCNSRIEFSRHLNLRKHGPTDPDAGNSRLDSWHEKAKHPISRSKDMQGIQIVAELMDVAARTAPKSVGEDFVVTAILLDDEVRKLGEAMIEYGERTGKGNFDRDGQNVLDSQGVFLVGLKDAEVVDLDCGACGAATCIEINTFDGEFQGPQCALRHLDMGIALGSAVDNRIMYRAGVLARELGQIDADFVMGIPLSATGKSIYFDR
jgi:uncharacterized ferredoxin-like protein